MELRIEQLLQSPRLKLFYDEAGETLRREDKARREFRNALREDVRAEFINGEVVVQMPARDRHTTTVRNTSTLFETFVKLHRLGAVRSEQALCAFTRNDYAPDICFWLKAKSRKFTPDQIVYPVPDLIVEVLSPSTAAADRGIKFEDYEAHSVQEYWIVDPAKKTIEQYVLRDGRFALVGKFARGTVRGHVVAGFEMPVRAAFNDAENLACLRRLLAR